MLVCLLVQQDEGIVAKILVKESTSDIPVGSPIFVSTAARVFGYLKRAADPVAFLRKYTYPFLGSIFISGACGGLGERAGLCQLQCQCTSRIS